MMRLFRKSVSRLLTEGKAAYGANDLERSIRLFGEAWGRGARDAEALHLLAAACRKTGRVDAAAEALAQALRLEFDLRADDDAATAAALAEMLWTQPLERWRHRLAAIEQLGLVYSRGGGYEEWGEALLARLAERDLGALARGRDQNAVFATLRLLDFSKNAPAAWIERLFSCLVWPWMRQALACGRYGLALMLETEAYGAYVMYKESGQRFRKAFAVWTDAMREAGRRAGESLTPLPAAPAEPVPGIGFYLHSDTVLGHTQILLEFLEAHARLEAAMIRPVVFVRPHAHADLKGRLAAIGVACIELEKELSDRAESDWHAFLRLRHHTAAQKLTAVVWVSVALHMAFAFSMRVAPVQIWWAMKYHSLALPEIDGYLTNQSAGSTKLVDGKLWRSAPLASEDWYRPQLAARAAEVRAGYAQHDLLLGCMGREEKLNSLPFLEAVATILKACPRAGFLWTGRERAPAVQAAFERFGVAERCHFIGWVDTKLYAQVLDLFLDSFPFPCGFTLYETMAAGKPVVVYASPEAAETGFYGLLSPLLSGATGTPDEVRAAKRLFEDGKLFYCARDANEYVALALKLATDPEARRIAGHTNRAFVRDFLSDRARMARAVGRHFIELTQAPRAG